MPARKQEHIAVDLTQALDHRVGPRRHLIRRFAAGAAMDEKVPVRTLLTDLGRAQTFVLAVIPFEQIRIELGDVLVSGERAGAGSTLQWARVDLDERQPPEPFAEPACVLFTARSQGQVGPTGMLARQTP